MTVTNKLEHFPSLKVFASSLAIYPTFLLRCLCKPQPFKNAGQIVSQMFSILSIHYWRDHLLTLLYPNNDIINQFKKVESLVKGERKFSSKLPLFL